MFNLSLVEFGDSLRLVADKVLHLLSDFPSTFWGALESIPVDWYIALGPVLSFMLAAAVVRWVT